MRIYASITEEMNREKKRLKYPIIVEGKYDKCTLSSLFSGLIMTLDGFSVFNSKEKQATLRRVAENGVIVLTDSDGGGKQLRSFVSGILPPDKVFHVYIPKIEGKERRKTQRSRAGYLGVEGMEPELLLNLLSSFTGEGGVGDGSEPEALLSSDFYLDGFSGRDNSSARRAELAKHLGLPDDMTAKALLSAINHLSLQDKYREFVNKSCN